MLSKFQVNGFQPGQHTQQPTNNRSRFPPATRQPQYEINSESHNPPGALSEIPRTLPAVPAPHNPWSAVSGSNSASSVRLDGSHHPSYPENLAPGDHYSRSLYYDHRSGGSRDISPSPRRNMNRRSSATTVSADFSRSDSATPHKGPLRCIYVGCPSGGFAREHDLRKHKDHCRLFGYEQGHLFQCTFTTCTSKPFTSHNSLSRHHLERHQIWLCVNCNHAFSGLDLDAAEEHSKTCAQEGGKPGETKKRENLQALWMEELDWLYKEKEQRGIIMGVLINGKSRCYDLYETMVNHSFGNVDSPQKGHQSEPDDASAPFISNEQLLRKVIIGQVISTLKTQYICLRDTTQRFTLTPEENAAVKRYLDGLTELLSVEIDREPRPSQPQSTSEAIAPPEIQVDSKDLDIATPFATHAEADKELICSNHVENQIEVCQSAQGNNTATIQGAGVTFLQTQIENEQKHQEAVHQEAAHQVVQHPLSDTQAHFVATAEDEPMQIVTLPWEQQETYYTAMLICCHEAVVEFYEAHKAILTADAGCAGENTQGLGLHFNGNPIPKGPSKKRRSKAKKPTVASQGAQDILSPETSTGSSKKSPSDHNLPHWTHHLRQLCVDGRIQQGIVANLDSFSGEIQPVDEVHHACRKQKVKSDRDLLALVQTARKFCWQLKDWERCKLLDDLYETIDGEIEYQKQQNEGWTVVTRKRGHRRENSLRASGGRDDATSGWDLQGRHTRTWPIVANRGLSLGS